MKLKQRPSMVFKAKQRRKTVRFSDIITINGSATSISSKESRRITNGTAKRSGINASTKYDNGPDKVTPTQQNSDSTSNSQVTMNGSIHSDDIMTTSQINMFENMLEERIAEEVRKGHTEQVINEEIDVLTNDVYNKERKKETILEWQHASAVIDRVFFIIFIFTLTLTLSFFLLHKIPYLSTDNI